MVSGVKYTGLKFSFQLSIPNTTGQPILRNNSQPIVGSDNNSSHGIKDVGK